MPPVSATLIAFLINATVQIIVVGVGAALALRIARSAPPHVAHRIAVVALVLCALTPIVSMWLATDQGASVTIVPATVDTRALTADWLALALVYGYAVVLLWRAFVLSRAVVSAIALRRSCITITDGPLIDSFHRCSTDGRIQLCRSSRVTTPLTFGLLNPVIVVPGTLAADDPGVIDASIAHECAHIARHDVAIASAIEVLTGPFAFHPVVTVLKRAAAQYRELACDERAMERLAIPPRAYAIALLRIAESGTAPAAIGAGVVSHLETRIRALLENDRRHRDHMIVRAFACACVLASIVIAPWFAVAIDGGWRNLSGIWTLDVDHSEPRGHVPFQSARMQIETDGNRLLIAQERTLSNGRFETFEIRGTSNDVPFKVYLPGSAAVQTRARWEGSRLITDAEGPGRRFREHGEAVADGDRLVIKTEHVYDNARTRYQLVFRRQ
jgi:beta-lactamase regulating signal transducer with metallopeptidase domain